MKFSIIVPVYNVEKYIERCLKSVVNQTYKDEYEVIIVNDGSTDDSEKIINKYIYEFPDKIKSFKKKNGGLSDARNYGINKASGEYLIFVDSDDYINEGLLEKIDESIENEKETDVIGYSYKIVDEQENVSEINKKPEFISCDGEEAIIKLVENKTVFEPAWGFAFRLDYWKKNNYEFEKNLYHEDFALIPIAILNAKKVTCLGYDGYFYVQTPNSIMRNANKEKEIKKTEDLIKGFDLLKKAIEKHDFKNEYSKRMLYGYIANEMLFKLEQLDGDLKQKYKKELNERNMISYVMDDTFKRKIRKILIKMKYKL